LAAHVEDVLIAASQLQRSSMGSMSVDESPDKDAVAAKRHQLEMLSQDTQKKFAESDGQEGELDEVRVEEPTAKACIMNTPWEVLPFLFGMFTLVNSLAIYGWIDALSTQILSVIPADEGNSMRAIAISTFLMATISFFFCMIMNNQPASILLAQVLIAPAFNKIPSMVRTAGMLGVLEGANVGSCWSLIGGLCGILWSTILRNKGIKIGYLQFQKMGFMVMPFVMIYGCFDYLG
jgi:Na+/H+ antiporter NhaD/arsenite permease-like protein